jgi:carboxylesterase type B
MRNYYASFAIYQDPNQLNSEDGRPEWPEFTKENQTVLEIDLQSIQAVVDPDANEKCDTLGKAPTKYVHI